jgi:hypothetical protein
MDAIVTTFIIMVTTSSSWCVDGPIKRKSFVGILFKGARRNRYGVGPNLQGHVFREGVNPIGVRTQGEGLIQIEAPCVDFELCEGRGERHQRGDSY